MIRVRGLPVGVQLALGDVAAPLVIHENQCQPKELRNDRYSCCGQKQGCCHGIAAVHCFQNRKQCHQQCQCEEGKLAVTGGELRILYVRRVGQCGFVLRFVYVQLAPIMGIVGGLPVGDVAYTVMILMVDILFEGGEDPVHPGQSVACQRLLVQPLLNGADVILLIGEKFSHEPMLLWFFW